MPSARKDGARDRREAEAPRSRLLSIRLTPDEGFEVEAWADGLGMKPSTAIRNLVLDAARFRAMLSAATPEQLADMQERWVDAYIKRTGEERVETVERGADRFRG